MQAIQATVSANLVLDLIEMVLIVPRSVCVQMPPRTLRVKEPLFKLDEGAEPLNPAAYLRRYGHQLDEETRLRVEAMIAKNESE